MLPRTLVVSLCYYYFLRILRRRRLKIFEIRPITGRLFEQEEETFLPSSEHLANKPAATERRLYTNVDNMRKATRVHTERQRWLQLKKKLRKAQTVWGQLKRRGKGVARKTKSHAMGHGQSGGMRKWGGEYRGMGCSTKEWEDADKGVVDVDGMEGRMEIRTQCRGV